MRRGGLLAADGYVEPRGKRSSSRGRAQVVDRARRHRVVHLIGGDVQPYQFRSWRNVSPQEPRMWLRVAERATEIVCGPMDQHLSCPTPFRRRRGRSRRRARRRRGRGGACGSGIADRDVREVGVERRRPTGRKRLAGHPCVGENSREVRVGVHAGRRLRGALLDGLSVARSRSIGGIALLRVGAFRTDAELLAGVGLAQRLEAEFVFRPVLSLFELPAIVPFLCRFFSAMFELATATS